MGEPVGSLGLDSGFAYAEGTWLAVETVEGERVRESKGNTFLESFLLLKLSLGGCRVYGTLAVFRHDRDCREPVDINDCVSIDSSDRWALHKRRLSC